MLDGHEVLTARSQGWDSLANGNLLKAAASGGFDVVITLDRSLPHQQDQSTLPIPVIVIQTKSSTVNAIAPLVPDVLRLLSQRLSPKAHYVSKA